MPRSKQLDDSVSELPPLHPPPPRGYAALSQQSRFEPSDTSDASKLVDVRDVSISIGACDLLSGAHLQLSAGTHYGLVGRNGTGKSILLQSIAHRWLPGLPAALRAFYVDQMEDAAALDQSILDYVLAANATATRAARAAQLLEDAAASDNAGMAEAALLAHRRRCLADDVTAARHTADSTSGARGQAARKQLTALERRLRGVALEADEDVGAAIQTALEAIYRQMEPTETRALRAQSILLDMGFSADALRRPVCELSGGWRIRVALATARFVDAQVLLLDEPTNHLDLPGILQLRALMDTLADLTLVTVSHDRAFLDDTADEIILLQGGRLQYFAGNYSAWLEAAGEQRAMRERQRAALDRKAARVQASITAERARAARADDSKKQAQLASKQRKLDERHGLDVNAKGHRFKLNRDR